MKILLITLAILLPFTTALAEDLPTFELPEPTETVAYVASTGNAVRVQLSVPSVIAGKSYAANELLVLTFEPSEEPQVITIEFEPADNKKIYISGATHVSFKGFVSYGQPFK